MRRRVLAALASAWLLSVGAARAEEPRRVGVVVGVRVNVPEPRADAILAAIERVLERELAVDIVAGSGAAIERDLPRGCATDTVCLSGLAARIEVDELLFLVVVGAGDRVRVELSRRHPVTGELSHPPALILDPDPERMDGQIAGVAAQLLPDATPRATAEPPAPPDPVPPVVVDERPVASGGSSKRTAGLITAAAGLALAGGGIYFAFKARSEADELEDRHPPDDPGTWSESDESLEDAQVRHRTWAAVLAIAGGAAVVTGATLYALGVRDRRRSRDPGVSLHLGAGGGVLVWSDVF
ncbi:MAG TPA: hypothetical protein VIG06_14410 [Kofleriaceae bacterium]